MLTVKGKKVSCRHAALLSTLFFLPTLSAHALPHKKTVTTTQHTSEAKNHTLVITPSGQIDTTATAQDAIVVDGKSGTGGVIQIEANNSHGINAVKAADGFVGIHILPSAAPNTVINIGAGSGVIFPSANAVRVDNAGTTITNAGTLQGNLSAIVLTANAVNTTITNQATGMIQNVGNATGAVVSTANGATGLVLNNDGTLQQTSPHSGNGIDTVQLNANFNVVNNGKHGVIQQVAAGNNMGNAITIGQTAAVTAGEINNQGQINSMGLGNAIEVTALNQLPSTVTIKNSGMISSHKGMAFEIGGNLHSLNNEGIISSTLPSLATIYAEHSAMPGGIVNSGEITNLSGGVAIDLFSGGANAITLVQNEGEVQGDIWLAARDGNGTGQVLIVKGGVIKGNVLANNLQANNLLLAGGTITGNVAAGDGGDTIMLTGTQIGGTVFGKGNTLFQISGGSFSRLQGAGKDAVTLTGTFALQNSIDDVATINVDKGTVTLLAPITQIKEAFTIASQATLTVPNSLHIQLDPGAGFENHGLLVMGSKSNLTIEAPAGFYQSDDGILQVQIDNAQSGQLLITQGQAHFSADSILVPHISGFLPAGATYNVVVADEGIIGLPSLIQPFATLKFEEQIVNDTILQLSIQRQPFQNFVSSAFTPGAAAALDTMAMEGPTHPDLNLLLNHLSVQTTPQAIDIVMESLVPPYNYGLIQGSHFGMDLIFAGVADRLSTKQWDEEWLEEVRRNYQGYNSGDLPQDNGLWIRALGASLEQRSRQSIAGYTANGAGLAIGWDGYFQCALVGIAASYTQVDVQDQSFVPKDQAIESYQGTLYGWYRPARGFFVDGMLGIARENIHSNRLLLGNFITASQADFHGMEIGAQVDGGYDFFEGTPYFVSPIVRIKYLHVDLDSYAEYGAGGLSLNVTNDPNDEAAAGIGVRLGMQTEDKGIRVAPEFFALALYDFVLDAEQTTASFVGGSPTFITPGAKPGRGIIDAGVGLKMITPQRIILNAKYSLEWRDHFWENAGYLQASYQF